MIYEFKSTLNRQWAVVSWSSIKYGLFIAYYFYSGPSSIYVIIVLIFEFFDLLPAVLLHGQYYKHDKNAKLVVDTSNSTIKYQNKREEKKVHFAEISFIKYVSSYGNDVISPAIYSFGPYGYCQICLKNGARIFVTCLMMHNIPETFEIVTKISVEKKLTAMPFLPINKGV